MRFKLFSASPLTHPSDPPSSPAALFGTVLVALLLVSVALVPGAVQAQQALSFSKSFSPSTIGPGSVSTLTFTITNNTSQGVRSMSFTDNLPASVTVASPAAATTNCLSATVTATAGGSSIAFSGGLGAAATCRVRVNVTSSTPGTHTNTSSNLTSDLGTFGPATADLIVATDRPGFRKSFSPSAVFFGERSRLTLTIDNSANSNGAANLAFTDTLPSGMVVASPANRSNTCGGALSAPAGGSTITLSPFGGTSLAQVAAGATCTVSLDVQANSVGLLGNVTGDLTSVPLPFGALRSSGRASAVLTVTFESIRLSKAFTDDPTPPGGTVNLRFTIRNLDRRSAATNITFSDDLDAVLSGLVAVGLPLNNVCGSGSQISGTGLITLTGGNLPAEGTCTFNVPVAVPITASAGTFANTTTAVSADVGGQPVTGAPATDLLFVEATPILTKEFTDDPAPAGGTVTLEFTVTNSSQDFAATDITFEDVLDEVLPTAASVPSTACCGAGSTCSFTPLINPPPPSSATPATFRLIGGNLPAGGSCSFSLVLDVAEDTTPRVITNTTSEITATVDGGEVVGNPATDDLEVVGGPRLAKQFIDDPAIPGGTVTLQFNLTYDEQASAPATGITFTDDLDATLSGLVATGLPASDVCGIGSTLSGTMTLTLSGGSLDPGETCTFNVTLQVPSDAPTSTFTNTTSAVVSTVSGLSVTSAPASDDLRIAGVQLTKEFIDDPAIAGGTVTLRFTIENNGDTEATGIVFQDDLGSTLDGLTATGLPASDVCGTGSSLTVVGAVQRLTLQDGVLAPGESCTFDVLLSVPANAAAGSYPNVTRIFLAVIGGVQVILPNASDFLDIADDFLQLEKEFVNDPVEPGDAVTLRFTVTNLSESQTISSIAFTDDLDAALSGLASTSGTLLDICGAGSAISGSLLLSFTGGSLGPDLSCTFDVQLLVPATADRGIEVTNTTSDVTGQVGGVPVDGEPASAVLRINALTLAKSFSPDTAEAGDIVTLTFTITNDSLTQAFTNLSFSDDLSAVIPGLTAIGLPATDVCGEGSTLSGTSLLLVNEASLLPGGSCSFSVALQVPGTASPGDFLNVTSDLRQFGLPLAVPAEDTLTIIEVVDDDGDGVLNGADLCPDTVIPEGVPTRRLGTNRFALVDGDFIFDTTPPGSNGNGNGNANGPQETFTTTDTGGCSCEQIIEALDLGNGHRFFGCSLSAMRDWVAFVNGADLSTLRGSDQDLESRRLLGGN